MIVHCKKSAASCVFPLFFMYPYLKWLATLTKARFRSKLDVDDKSVRNFRAGITDIDMFFELNHARYFNYMELGRWEYCYRIGFLDLLWKKKWGIAIGGASVRYRRRIPFFSKFTLSTQMICHDGRWLYFLQETHRNSLICSSALIKVGITSKDGLVPAPEVAKAMGHEHWGKEIPEWISAWIEAESQRPWPSSESL
jgi:acyl-CoA thioesterase FadM